MMDESFYSQNDGYPVYLNIYSFCHCCNLTFGQIGLGLYHTAIQIYGVQFMFHGWAGQKTGVSQVIPRTCPYRFQQQILLGRIQYNFRQLDQKIIQPLRIKYKSNRYDLLNNNCNHFALQMAQRLGVGNAHPRSYVFRITNFLNLFRCCLPACILSGRLDWFTSKKEQQQQLNQIRNSQIKHNDGNSQKYQQFIEDQEIALLQNKSRNKIIYPRDPHQRPKIFQIRTKK